MNGGLVAGKIGVDEFAAVMVDQVSNQFETKPLYNADLTKIGKEVLDAQQDRVRTPGMFP
jgi:hypothetical protein